MRKTYILQFHHSGKLNQRNNYVGGSIELVDNVDPNMMSYFELEDMVDMLQLGENKMFYRDPIGGQLIQIINDGTVMQMFMAYNRSSLIKIYVTNTENEDYSLSAQVLHKWTEYLTQSMDDSDPMQPNSDYVQPNSDHPNNDHVQPNSDHVQAASVEENVHNDVSVNEEDEIYDGENTEELDDVSVYALSDELRSIHSDSDDEIHVPCKKSEFIARREMGEKEKILMVGMEFATFAEFKDMLREHAIKNKYDIKFVKNDGQRVTFQTSKLGTSSYLANKYVHKFRRDPEWKNSGFMGQITDDLNLVVSRFKIYRAKRKCQLMIDGTHEDQFSKIREYCQLVLETNPGSVARVDACLEPDGKSIRFERQFFSLDAMWKGFKEGCRPFIGLDGCFLKTHYNQHLLSAIGKDGDNSFYPIAFGIVEAETKETWDWFLANLMDLLSPYKPITFISDRQKGLVNTLEKLGSDHRFCVRHMYDNFKKKFPRLELKQELWDVANSFTVVDFEGHMQRIREVNTDAYDWLAKIPPHLWAKCKYTEWSKCDLNNNSMCESWNSYTLKARDKPIITMLEMIRKSLLRRYPEKKEYMEGKNGLLCPSPAAQLKLNKRNSMSCPAHLSEKAIYEVEDGGMNEIVDSHEKSCSCRVWDIKGIPCKHACVAIQKRRWAVLEESVNPYFYRETFLKSYAGMIYPMTLRNMREVTGVVPIIPPIARKPPGRPKKVRKKAHDEGTSSGKHVYK
ncbi:uncharacterized protein LOC132281095 [Cornus florida]|uniref:uncharacterized protein LOC132281095 n=1 Tax=Cornus florida TaxID=4283 RepID=UPI00289BDA6A|nr:uncharacterized protein LOC132281095 [Cornus florida]